MLLLYIMTMKNNQVICMRKSIVRYIEIYIVSNFVISLKVIDIALIIYK
jgi:hypothetical protein